ncbi:MAG: thiamine pyrophosphate-binding protein [Candidatus Lokiarchaeota archaeon]|nr:thiamine pyrophosphate-binding protein [Candidatus Lokiarchaeota archaeon]
MSEKQVLTGSEVIVNYLIKEGVKYVFGIPGHGCLGLTDAFQRNRDKIIVIQPKQEMAGVHMAVGYYRVTGRPLAVFTSIGPGATNTAIGLADAFVDSMPVLVITGDTHVHMRGVGVLQEIERHRDSGFPRVLEPLVKRQFELAHVNQVPKVIQRAFNIMMTGRKGPVHIDIPMDVQCAGTSISVPNPILRKTLAKPRAELDLIKNAVKLFMSAERPLIWLGGGVINSEATDEVIELAEFVGSPVLGSMMAKDAFPNDHPLFGWATGSKGTTVGIELSRKADVVLAIGTRFADESTCSYRKGSAWNFGEGEEDTKLIQIDIDPHEIGKNYPVNVGIIGDAKVVLRDMITELKQYYKPSLNAKYSSTHYFKEIQSLKKKWKEFLDEWRKPELEPVMISCVLKEVREFLDRDAIIVTSSGNVQAQIIQEIEFYEPRTCITAGGFSTMGYSVPAAIGAKLGQPDRQVIALVGDGDFMMTMGELHTAVQVGKNLVIVILNNAGWIAITDLQRAVYGDEHAYATEFEDTEGFYSPNFADIAKGFGCWSTRISRAKEIKPALKEAFAQKGVSVVEILVNRDPRYSGSPAWGWWDVPIPTYLKEKREKYLKELEEEDLS